MNSQNIKKTPVLMKLFSNLYFIVLFLSTTSLTAQTGKISGVIIDKDTKEELIGASVLVEGYSVGAATDIDGSFSISIAPGTYKLKVSYIGYQTKLIEDVVVKTNETTVLNIALSETVGELEAVEVVAFAKTNTEASVLLEIKQTDQMASGISAQQISRSLDRDAAQVVRRVPGVTLIGNFVNIRGLNPRYNNVLLHNATAPSLETDIKSFSFDIIPSGQIDKIIILKSPSSDVTGDFAGGIVKLYTKSIPNENFYNLQYTSSVRSGTTFNDFLTGKHGGLFHLTFDNYHQLPADFPRNLRSSSTQELIKSGRDLPNDWEARQVTAIPDQRIAFNMGHRIQGKKALIGETTSLNYSNTRATFNVDRNDFNAYDFINNEPSVIYNFQDVQYNTNVRLGIIHNWTFRMKKGSSIDFKNLANFNALSQYIFRGGEHYEFNYFPANHSFDQVFRGITSSQLLGRHEIMKGSAEVNWLAGFGFTYRNQPDYKRYRSDRDTSNNSIQLFIPVGNAQPNFLGRFYSTMKEYVATANINYLYRIGYSKQNSIIPTLTVGTYLEYKDRSFDARNIGFIRAPQFDINLLNASISELFQADNINNTTGVILDEQSNPSDSYTANNILGAGYAKIEVPLSQFKLVGGLRYEYFLQRLNTFSLTNDPINVNRPNNFILPSVNMSYAFNKSKMLARASYGMSVNNPEFREMAPFGFYDFNYNFTFAGNPDILSCTVHNAELKWEFYPVPTDVINFSVFYKRFINPIEIVVVPGSGSGGAKFFSFNNAENANLFGVEIELKKSFTEAANKFFRKVGVMFNGAYLNSNVALGEAAVGQSDNRPLQGQSPYVINAGLFLSDREKNYQVNILYNVAGEKIMFVGFQDYPDIYEMPRHTLDLSASYLFKKGVEITAGVADILNYEVLWLQDGNNNGKLERNKDQQIQRFRPGSVYSVGIKYNFQ
jgi:outer membrane receptor for ferrienterochelin and colicin